MEIVDLTHLIQPSKDVYVFNPSILQLTPALFLLSYRICFYDIPIQCPPWRFWNEGFKYFENRNVFSDKCRVELGPARRVPFEMPVRPEIRPEFDSTGLALLEKDAEGEWSVRANNVAPFDREMNQDARLVRMEDGEIRISYNVFVGGRRWVLRWRTLEVRLDEWMYSFSGERDMFHARQEVEKNCVFFKDKILYSIGQTICFLNEQEILHSFPCPLQTYAGVHVSSSASPIAYRNGTYVGVGHIKVDHTSPLLSAFYAVTNIKQIVRYSQYIYFMFLFELTPEGHMLRVSAPFIPSQFMNHLPYLLPMATGFCQDVPHDRWLISYGEGDCRCKLLSLTTSHVEQLLRNEWHGDTFHYLCPKPTINHIGYFNKGNTGDECFRHVFAFLKDAHYPSAQLNFCAPGDYIPPANTTIFGGGDIITSYFLSNLPTENALAIGVGIPYAAFRSELARFRHVFLRDSFDAAELGVAHIPDLAFFLPRIFRARAAPVEKQIGISILQTYWHPEYQTLYDEYLACMTTVVEYLMEQDFKVVLLPFGINARKPAENDLIACMQIRRRLNYPSRVTILKPVDPATFVEDMYEKVSQMEFMICARFHSHIFATIHHVPFVSVTLGRKCLQFMRMAKLEENVFRLKANEIDLPVEMNANALIRFFRTRYAVRRQIQERICVYEQEAERRLQEFEQTFVQLLKAEQTAVPICLFPEDEEPVIEMDVEEEKQDDEIPTQTVSN